MRVPALASEAQRERSLFIWAAFLVSVALSWVLIWHFTPNGLDDALISYRYSERLLDGKGLTWNDAEHVEGYSNFLWVLLVAAAGLFQRNLMLAGWALGFLENTAVLAALVWAFGRSAGGSMPSLLTGLFLFASSAAFGFWGAGGMETALVEALLAWSLALIYRLPTGRLGWLWPSVMLALLALTRPDGILLAACVLAGVLLRDGVNRAVLMRVAGMFSVPLAFYCAQLLFRIIYYHDLVPNTAYAKVAFSYGRIWIGCRYVAQGAVANGVPILAVAGLIVWLWRSRRYEPLRTTLVFLVPAIAWLGYVAAIGGDFFPYYRFWMAPFVCLVFALSALLEQIPATGLSRSISVAAILVILTLLGQQLVDPLRPPRVQTPETGKLLARTRAAFPEFATDPLESYRREIRECMTIGEFLGSAFGKQQPLLAVNYAGCMPYSSKLPSLDMLGLNDRYIAHHRPTNVGTGFVGHELGDGAYVLSRKPDFVAFCIPATGALEPCLRSETEMAGMSEFKKDYRLVHYRVDGVGAQLWTRIEGGKVGVVRTPETITIPGFLLATTPAARAVPGLDGAAVTELQSGEAALDGVYFPPGKWQVSLEARHGDPLELSIPTALQSTAVSANVIEFDSSGTTQDLRVSGGPGLVYSISAKRLAQ